MIQWKLDCPSRKQKRKNQPIPRPGIEHCDWFILPLLLATPTMQFSQDRKRRSYKQMRRSAPDFIRLIFFKSYRSMLLIKTPTTTPSPEKTSLTTAFIWLKNIAYETSVKKIGGWEDERNPLTHTTGHGSVLVQYPPLISFVSASKFKDKDEKTGLRKPWMRL